VEIVLQSGTGLAALTFGAFAAVDVVAVRAVVVAAFAALKFVNPMTAATAGLASVADDFLVAGIDVAGRRGSFVGKATVLFRFGTDAIGNSRHR
jgi:hypothetical protein